MSRHMAMLPVLVLVLSFSGCAHPPPPERVQAVAMDAPPPPRAETRGHAPHAGWVWIAGYWNRVNDQFVWVPGFWGVPPSGFSSWDAAHWVHDTTRGWVLVRGRWR